MKRFLFLFLMVFIVIFLFSCANINSFLSSGVEAEKPEQKVDPITPTPDLAPQEPEEPDPEVVKPEIVLPEFKTDISSYLDSIEPKEVDKYIFLVNSDNPLSSTYVPESLTEIPTRNDGRDPLKMEYNAARALTAFLAEAEANGVRNVTAIGAYRSYNAQSWIFDGACKKLTEQGCEDPESEARKTLNPAGESEHQSGLAADINNLPTLESTYDYFKTKDGKWLVENSKYFGFILRYPEDKSSITGITNDPCHFRFVGRAHSIKMADLNMCLEEYIEYLKY